jgi:hypothetical protein
VVGVFVVKGKDIKEGKTGQEGRKKGWEGRRSCYAR